MNSAKAIPHPTTSGVTRNAKDRWENVWKFKVYNALTLPMLALGLLYHGVTGGAAALGDSVQGMLVGFAILYAHELAHALPSRDERARLVLTAVQLFR